MEFNGYACLYKYKAKLCASVVDSADHYFRSQTLDAKSIVSLFSVVGSLTAKTISKP